MKCPVNTARVRSEVTDVILDNKRNVETLLTELNNVIKVFARDFYVDNDSSGLIATTIHNTARRMGVLDMIQDKLTITDIKDALVGADEVVEAKDTVETSRLKDAEQARTRRDASMMFLDDAFGVAQEVKTYVQRETDRMLFNAMFINRDQSFGDLGAVRETLLNENIRKYQEILFKRIWDYLYSVVNDNADRRYNSNKKDIELLDRYKTLYENGAYTYALSGLSELLKSHLSPETIGRESIIRSLYKGKINGDPTSSLKFDAYTAYVILKNFDSYLSGTFGKGIKIKQFGPPSNVDKYAISHLTANLVTTWRTTEDINVESEAGSIIKLALRTTPVYKYGSNEPLAGRYLNFSDFEHTICWIKDLVYKEEASDIVFDDEFFNNHESFGESISNETKEYIKNKSLRELITSIRANPTENLHPLFEVISNEDFIDTFSDLYNGFSQDEKNKLYSINKGFFNDEDGLNFRALTRSNPEVYSYVTQIADSVFKISYMQYFRDQDGKLQIRTLSDSAVDNVRRGIEQNINVGNSLQVVNWDKKKEQLRLELVQGNDPYSTDEKAFKGIRFTVPNTNVVVTVNPANVSIQYGNGEPIRNWNEFIKLEPVRKFIDQTLKLNLEQNETLRQNVIEVYGSEAEAYASLLSFASRVVLNQYVQDEFISKATSKEDIINTIYGDGNTPSYNWIMDEVSMVSRADVYSLYNLALAKANESGLNISSTVRDGENNTQSNSSLSRLLGSYQSLFDLQERQPDSATNHFSLLNVNGLLEGVFNAKEFYDGSNTKEVRSMNVGEMSHALFLYDFIDGLAEKPSTENHIIGNGYVSFLPSVNSDKNTVGRLLINLNKKIQGYLENKSLKDYTADEIKGLISKEIGTFYNKIGKKVQSDWKSVDRLVSFNAGEGAPSLASDFVNNFKNFNNWFNNIPVFENTEGATSFRQGNEITFVSDDRNSYVFIQYDNVNDCYIVHSNNPLDLELQSKALKSIPAGADIITQDAQHNLSNLASLNDGDFIEIDGVEYQTYRSLTSGVNIRTRREIKNRYKTPINYIKSLVSRHNSANRLNPIELVDQIHFIGKGNLEFNPVALSLIARFNPSTCFGEFGINPADYINFGDFWNIKKGDILRTLINNHFRVNLLNINERSKAYLNNMTDWVNSSNDMIIAKVRIGGQTIPISSEIDLLRVKPDGISFDDFIDQLAREGSIEIHPELERYNLFDYLFTQEFMCATVGTHIAHDPKVKIKRHPITGKVTNILELEAAHFNAQNKRNVSFTAAMHAFQLNSLNGIADTYNIAVIDDIRDKLATVDGHINGIKPFDGATFVNPFVVYLENNSLGESRAGITKKQFLHFKSEKTGNGGIIKTAGFGLTNDWIRNSPFLAKINKKMTDLPWLNENGTEAVVNILQDFKSNDITYSNLGEDPNSTALYFKDGDRFYKIVSIVKLGEANAYERVAVECTEHGEEKTDSIKRDVFQGENAINTNYRLWKFFGGEFSMSLNSNKLEFSNSSIEQVVKAINSIGTTRVKNSATGERYSTDEVTSQKQLWQPLKHADVHYLATAGAVKQGAANINSANKYTNDERLDYQRVHTYQSGIQLDKEHHADESELSMMTQVISACAAKGYTFEAASSLYDALKRATDKGLEDHLKGLNNFFSTNSNSSLLELVIKSLIDNLGNSRDFSGNFAAIIARDLISKAKEGVTINYKEQDIPLSDNTVFAKITSIIATTLTNTGIKYKIPGILAVLTPSYNSTLIYDGKKYEAYSNPEQQLQEIQDNTEPIYSKGFVFTSGDIEFLDHNVIYVNEGELVSVKDGLPVGARNDRNGNILVDLETIHKKYNERAWERVRNSQALDYDFKSFEEFLNFVMLHEAMHTRFPLLENESAFDYETRVNNEALDRLTRSISDIEMDRTYIIVKSTRPDNVLRYTDGTPVVANLSSMGHYLGTYYLRDNAVLFDYSDYIDPETGQVVFPEDFDPYLYDGFVMLDGSIEVNEDKTNNAIPTTTVENRLIKTPKDLRNLKSEINAGDVLSVTENKKVGRNLAAYNVRFKGDGIKYQLWEIDSIGQSFDLIEISDSDFDPELINDYCTRWGVNPPLEGTSLEEWYEKEFTRVNRRKQLDLMNLSESSEDVLKQFDDNFNNPNISLSTRLLNRFTWFTNIRLGTGHGNEIELDGERVRVTPDNFDYVRSRVRKILEDTTKVRINNQLVTVDKSSIQKFGYEVQMPKTFLTDFGLNTYDSVEEIANNKDFFIIQYIKKRHLKVPQNDYTIALRNGNGRHYYLLDKSDLPNTDLRRVDNIIYEYRDGKRFRTDDDGNVFYELRENDEVYYYQDRNGERHEVIVSDDINFYLDSMHYDSLKLSPALANNELKMLQLLDSFKNSDNKRLNKFYRYITFNREQRGVIDPDKVMRINDFEITEENYKSLPEDHPVIQAGRAKHSSFLQSLHIVAARIPAQSMQSFMPMKVVSFDNPDINTAYVSTMQILLQGSKAYNWNP